MKGGLKGRSALRRERKAGPGGLSDRIRVQVLTLAQHIRSALAIALLAHCLQSATPALAAQPAHALVQQVELERTGPGPGSTRPIQLGEQPPTHWLGGLIEVFAPVTPKCETVADKHAQQECQQWERSLSQRWQQFLHDHPKFVSELIVAGICFVIGFLLAAS
jgi:hypothetical protein